MKKELRFDEQAHKYFVGDHELISVTTLLKEMGLTWFPDNEAVRLKMELGTYVHHIIECYNKSKLGLLKFNPVNLHKNEAIRKERGLHEALPYFEAYKNWFTDVEPEIIEVEQRSYHPQWFYAGTVDLKCKIDGQLAVVDSKTGVQVPAVNLQLGAYGELERHWNSIMPKGFSLYLRPDETYRFIETKEMQTQANTFLSALQVWQWKQKNNIKDYDYE